MISTGISTTTTPAIKPWYTSSTVQAAIANLALAILTAGVSIHDGKFNAEVQVPILVAQACAFLQTVNGRIEAKSAIYTPDYLPGPNLNELEVAQAASVVPEYAPVAEEMQPPVTEGMELNVQASLIDGKIVCKIDYPA